MILGAKSVVSYYQLYKILSLLLDKFQYLIILIKVSIYLKRLVTSSYLTINYQLCLLIGHNNKCQYNFESIV